jgi:pimeloyl-ACP methyl ester carboxylesterase
LEVAGVVAISPPLRLARSEHLVRWAAARKPVVAIVPENDQFVRPAEARARFAMLPAARVVEGPGAGHLWIGEKSTRLVLDTVVDAARPGFGRLPTTWDGPFQTYRN